MALIFWFFVIGFYSINVFGQKKQKNPCDFQIESGGISTGDYGNKKGIGAAIDLPYNPVKLVEEKSKIDPEGTRPLQITSKPRALYTELARNNCVKGIVKLKITFYADGTIGKIKIVKGLPDGLTEQAIAVARRIKFEPAKKRGKLITVTKTVEYTFTIY